MLIGTQRPYHRNSTVAPGIVGFLSIAAIVGISGIVVFSLPMPAGDTGQEDLSQAAARIATAPASEAAPAIETHLYSLESETVDLRKFDSGGGAIQGIGDDLLVVSGRGNIAVVRRNKSVEYLEGRVPMNREELATHEIHDDTEFRRRRFRVNDILLREKTNHTTDYDLFVTHYYFTENGIRNRLSSTTVSLKDGRMTIEPPWRTIFDVDPPLRIMAQDAQNSGGRMLVDGPRHLLVTIGDQGMDGWNDRIRIPPGSYAGKVLRVEIETGDVEILTSGHRNPQGFARDPDGTLWVTEHGPYGGDELNVLERGGDYGWPNATYGLTYSRSVPPGIDVEDAGSHDGFLEPVFSWVPSVGISNLVVNDDRWFPLWRDDLLIASLSGNSGAGLPIFRVRRNGANVRYVERIRIGKKIRDITQMRDGRIALLLSDNSQILFLSRSTRAEYCGGRGRWIYAVGCGPGDAKGISSAGDTRLQIPAEKTGSPAAGTPDAAGSAGTELFGIHCRNCHNPHAEQHGIGPHLLGVTGRRAGIVEGWRFSPALRALDLTWTRESLERFIVTPERFAPGTFMSPLGVSGSEASAIVDFLAARSDPRRTDARRRP